MSSASGSALPSYTPSGPVPSYWPELGTDELLLDENPRDTPLGPSKSTRTVIRKFGRDSLLLDLNQVSSAQDLTYGRHGLISGLVEVEEREKIEEVLLTLNGKVEARITERGSTSKTILDESHTLWSHSGSGSEAVCPSTVPFSIVLPAKFQDGPATLALPPSYSMIFSARGGTYAKIAYTLSIIVNRGRGRKLIPVFFRTNTTTVSFTYSPCARPARPIQPLMPFSSSLMADDVQLVPEEWRQSTTTAHACRPNSPTALAPVDLQVYIPTIGVFALTDKIPVRVRLVGSVLSLREFFPQQPRAGATAEVRVALVRQLLLQINRGNAEPCQYTLGSAVLTPTLPTTSDDGALSSLAWAGELCCQNTSGSAEVGSFDAGIVKAQDFITVEVVPTLGPKSQFARVRHSQPVRLVTHSWAVSGSN